MPQYNADTAFEPIEVILDGIVYKITTVSQETLSKIRHDYAELEKEGKEPDGEIVYKQLGLLFSVEPKEFVGKDIRKLTAILRFVQQSIQGAIETKNA